MKVFTLLTLAVAPLVVAAPAVDVKPRTQISDDAPKPDSKEFIAAIMDAHWYWRRIHCAQDLTWDPELAQQALASVSACTQHPQHDTGGSNLSSSSPAPKTWAEWIEAARSMVHGWHEEETKYPYQDPSYKDNWGHFTQMVWRNTSRIGCAFGHCADNVDFPGRLYCFYSWAGNNIAGDEFRKNVWPPVCPDPTQAEAEAAKAQWA